MSRTVPIFLLLAATLLVAAPFVIAGAPQEATMGLVQKIFYFHFPSALLTLISAIVCGVASAFVLFKPNGSTAGHVANAAAELAVVFGAIVFVTGPLWGRRAWGVWWQWDGRVTSTFVMWLVFCSYLLLRRYGGAGSDKLAAAVGFFGMALVPFVYWSVQWWRTIHPQTTVVPNLPAPMAFPLWLSVAAFACLYVALLNTRVALGRAEAARDAAWLEVED